MRFIPSILRSFPFNVMLYFVGLLSPPLPAAAASYDRIQTLSMDEGLPHSDVNAITQDRDGYLWFATFSGLSKYDGYRLQTFRTDNSDLTSDRILCLFVARDSSLYIGTESGGLNRYDPVSETIFPVADNLCRPGDQQHFRRSKRYRMGLSKRRIGIPHTPRSNHLSACQEPMERILHTVRNRLGFLQTATVDRCRPRHL